MEIVTGDVEAKAKRPRVVAAAAAALGIEGVFVFLVGLQNVTFVRWVEPYCYAVYALLVVGAACAALAMKVARVKVRSLVLGMIAALALIVGTAAWLVIGIVEGVFSILSVATVFGAVASLALLGTALPYCREAERARAALRAQGIDYDL